jgi:uncharacterized protein YecT (DUF1311 family)
MRIITHMKWLILCVLVTGSASAFAQDRDRDTQKDTLCEQSKSVPLPAEASSIPKPKTFPTCDSYKLYAGIGGKVDYVAARKCAWSERLAMEAGLRQGFSDPIPWVIGGSVILSQLYANGKGVPRNLPLALHLACEEGASEERDAIEDLSARIQEPGSAAKDFRFCDHAMTTFSMNFCASYDAEIHDQQRSDAIDLLLVTWTPEQRNALAFMEKLERAYARAHERGEINTSGTIRNLRAMGAYEQLRDDFVEALKAFEKGRIPKYSAADAAKSDAELNRLYRDDMAASKAQTPDYGPPPLEGIRTAERAWIKYRDAWIGFARLRYSSISSDSWLALLTNDRIAVLKDTYCQIGQVDDAETTPGYACTSSEEDDARPPRPLP